MKRFLIPLLYLFYGSAFSQPTAEQLDKAFKKLETDEQFKHAIISLYVVDTKTGKVVFDKNSQTGLAPASCQKVITSATAFELLGKNFRYTTYIGIDRAGNNKFSAGSLFIIGRGDPSLGSWRWRSTVDTSIFSGIAAALRKKNINSFERNLYVDDSYYGTQTVPDGWIWQDMGNYYGASCLGFNWHENQYDLILQSGQREGDRATVIKTIPVLRGFSINNGIYTGSAGSGDNAYIYTAPFTDFAITSGTIPMQKGNFTITGSLPDPAKVFNEGLINYLQAEKIIINDTGYSYIKNILTDRPVNKPMQIIDSIQSPVLDSINFWFINKSVNLFGESFLKSMVMQKYPGINPMSIYDSANRVIKNFWSNKGIERSSINMYDGSGLSPANRVTTNALVTVMQYAKTQDWFPSFYNALPVQNGIKMKSGYIGGVRSYTGYVKSKTGNEYTFSVIVNNFDGNPGTAREKMWKVLDILK